MLRRTALRPLDYYREAQQGIVAALSLQDRRQRLSAINDVVSDCLHIPGRRSSVAKDPKRRMRETATLLTAVLSRCRVEGAWEEALAIAARASQHHRLPLREQWFTICLEAAPPSERRALLPALEQVFKKLPATVFASSLEAATAEGAAALGEGGTSRDGEASTTSKGAVVPFVPPVSSLSAASVAVNPSFVDYIRQQRLVPADHEAALIAALTGASSSSSSGAGQSYARREIVVRVNRSVPGWEITRALLEQQRPLLEPFPWYPEQLLWRVAVDDATAIAANGASESSATHRHTRLRTLLQSLVDEGSLSYQSVSSALPALALYGTIRGQPSLRVLDACAAPGGKTQQIVDLINADSGSAASASDRVLVVANDADARRLLSLRRRLQDRAPFVAFTNFRADGFPLPSSADGSAATPPMFDAVLLDAPCSGEGRLQRDAVGWRRWHPQAGLAFHRLQLRALRRAIAACEDGGTVVYSTCTLNPIENEAVVAAVVAEGIADVAPLWPRAGKGGRGAAVDDPLRSGTVPVSLAPFLTSGLRQWGVPLADGTYYRPSSDSHDGRRPAVCGRGPLRHVDASMLPPAPAIGIPVSRHTVRVLPMSVKLADGESVVPPADEAAPPRMEAFFLAKLTVKLSPERRRELLASLDAAGPTTASSKEKHDPLPPTLAHRFVNASRFVAVTPDVLAKAQLLSQRKDGPSGVMGAAGVVGGSSDGALAVAALAASLRLHAPMVADALWPHSDANSAPNSSSSPTVFLRTVAESALEVPAGGPPAAVRHVAAYAMAAQVVQVLQGTWRVPARVLSDPSIAQKRPLAPAEQALQGPGVLLWHALVPARTSPEASHPRAQAPSAALLTDIGASALAQRALAGGEPNRRVIEVSVRLLQLLLQGHAPFPEPLAAALEGDTAQGAAMCSLLGLLDAVHGSGALGRLPATVISHARLADPLWAMHHGGGLARDTSPRPRLPGAQTLLDALIGGANSSSQAGTGGPLEAGPLVLAVRPLVGSEPIAVPAVVLPFVEGGATKETPNSGDQELLARLGRPGSRGDRAGGAAAALLVLAPAAEALGRLKLLLPKVLGSEVRADRALIPDVEKRSFKSSMLPNFPRTYLLGTDLNPSKDAADVNARSLVPDVSVSALQKERVPAVLLAARAAALLAVGGGGDVPSIPPPTRSLPASASPAHEDAF